MEGAVAEAESDGHHQSLVARGHRGKPPRPAAEATVAEIATPPPQPPAVPGVANRANRRAAGLMLAGSVIFAAMAACTHALGSRCDWSVIAFARVLFMGVTVAVVALASGVRLRLWDPRSLWMRSLAGSLSLVCNFYALTALPIGDASTLNNSYPLWIALLSWWAVGLRVGLGEVIGVACGLVGMILVQQPHFREGNLATLVALLSSFATAVAMLGLHRLRDVDPRAVVTHFAMVGTVAAAVVMAARWDAVRANTHLDATAWLLLVGVCASGTLGQVFLTRAFASGPPASVAAVGLSQVAFGALLDIAIWGRVAPMLTWVGMALVLAPTAWLMARGRARP